MRYVTKQFQVPQILDKCFITGSYQPSNVMKLRFYGYFKQATEGPCKGPRPPFWEAISRAKYDAWKALGDMPKATAMAKYVEELHK